MKKYWPRIAMTTVATRLGPGPPNQALTITAAKKQAHGVGFKSGHVA